MTYIRGKWLLFLFYKILLKSDKILLIFMSECFSLLYAKVSRLGGLENRCKSHPLHSGPTFLREGGEAFHGEGVYTLWPYFRTNLQESFFSPRSEKKLQTVRRFVIYYRLLRSGQSLNVVSKEVGGC